LEVPASQRKAVVPDRTQSLRARDPSLLSLLAANLVTIVMALWQRWDLAPLMWVYWGQSCLIGWFNFARILSLQEFSTENFKIGGRPAKPTRSTQVFTAFFFLFHYGFFHVGYMVFLRQQRPLPADRFVPVLICVGIFALNHLYSFLRNLESDRRQQRNLGTVMSFPYARIIPMHLTIIAGATVGAPSLLLLFLILKTVADLVMHVIEHKQKQDPVLAGAASREGRRPIEP
jgi:hypothetical protein